MKRMLILGLGVVVVVGLVGAIAIGPKAWRWYQNQRHEELTADSVVTPTIGGQTAYVAADDAAGPRRLLIFAHGHSGRHDALTLLRVHDFAQQLVDDGWVIAASDAHGDAWGSEESQQDYLNLYRWAADHYDIDETVIVAESMGAVASLQIAANGSIPTLDRWVGLSPIVDVAEAMADDSLGGTIESEATGTVPDPNDLPAGALDGVALGVVVAVDDDTVPPETGEAFAEKYGADLATCTGGHVAKSCFADVARMLG